MNAAPTATATTADVTHRLATHAASLTFDRLPAAAVSSAKTFLLDTLGVGIAGRLAPLADKVLAAVGDWGDGTEAPVLGRKLWCPAAAAAFVNAFQIHAQEFDCVHEGAVVHPMATLLAALMADTPRIAPRPDGKRFLTALVAGVDVAAGLGLMARSPLKFFRPATAGIFGSVAGLANLRGLDVATTVDAFGHALAFASGTMQAHVEGRPGLPLQIANAARNALNAVDLARHGVPGVTAALEGPFGYLRLFEDDHAVGPGLDGLGQRFRITELSHKPFPTGRAAHGAIGAVQALRRDHGVNAETLVELVYRAPPLIHRLVGRPIHADLTPNYARLCFPYLGAVTLLRGGVGLGDFQPGVLADPRIQDLATRFRVDADDNPDPAAFVPATAEATLTDGRTVRLAMTHQLGSPAAPLSRVQQLEKFHSCLAFAGFPRELADAAIARVDRLEAEPCMASFFEVVGSGF